MLIEITVKICLNYSKYLNDWVLTMLHSPITLEALFVLDAIDNRGSFAAAAEQLNKVPSALSYIVQKLEDQLSVTLFVRQGRRSVLTPAGRHLLDEGRKLIGAVSKITEQTQTISHGWEPRIRIAFDSIIDVQTLYAPLKQFLYEHPNIEIDLQEQVMNGTWEALHEDRVDLLIGAPASVKNQPGLRLKPFSVLNHVFVVPTDHELVALKRDVTTLDIQAFRAVVVHDSAKNDIPWSSNIIQQSRRFYVTSVEHKIKAIMAGIGVGFLPKHRIQNYLKSGELVALSLADPTPDVELLMVWRTVNKGKGLRRLVDILSE